MSEEHPLYEAVIDNDESQTIEVSGEVLDNADILRLSQTLLHVLEGHQSTQVEVLDANYQTKEFVLRISGRDIHVKLRDQVETRVHAMGFDVNTNHQKQTHVASPMPGLVLKVLVNEGDEVREGQPVVVLEAMKMENVLNAPADGVVSKVHAQEKRNVDKGQVLVELA